MTTVTPLGRPRLRGGPATRLPTSLALCLVGGLAAGLVGLLPSAAAATSTAVPELATSATDAAAGTDRAQLRDRRRDQLLALAVRQREQALAAIDQQAEQHEDDLAAEIAAEEARIAAEEARLAALGYTGDLADLTHVLPLGGYHLSAGFGLAGPLWESTHTGLDFGAAAGTPLVAVGDGTITSVGDAGPYGLRTVLTLEDGTDLWYAHQLTTLVEPGQQVEVGQPIGAVGSTGNSTGPHLHLEVRPGGGGPVDPVAWLTAVGVAP